MTVQPQSSTPPGWYFDSTVGVERWWDGYAWTAHTRAAVAQVQPAQPVQPTVIVQQQRGPRRVVTKSPKHTSHLFHLVMTILTGGVWALFVWLPLTILHKMQHEKSVTRIR